MIKLLYFRVVLILLTCISTIPVFSQNSDSNPFAFSVCTQEDIEDVVIDEVPDLDVRSTCSTGYTESIQFRIVKIRRAGTFTFQITPATGNVDYDFLSWKLSPGHPNYADFDVNDVSSIDIPTYNRLPPADRGNRNTGGQGRTVGLRLNAPTLCRGVEGDGLERHYDAQVGDIIIIGIDNFGDGDFAGINFGGDAELNCAVDFYECINEETNLATFDLDSYVDELRVPNTNYEYHFYNTEEHASTNLPENRITDRIITLPYSDEGRDVFLTFVVPNGNLDIIGLKLKPLKPLNLLTDTIYGCFAGQNPQTGVSLGRFNLKEALPEEALNNRLAKIKIFRTLAQAEANGTAGLIPENQWENHNGVSGTYYVRMEYDLGEGNLKCTKILPLNLQIIRVQLEQTVKNVDACYEEVINLTEFESYFAGAAVTEYDFKYYSGTTLITNPTSYEVLNSRTIRVVIGKGSCTSEATININLLDTPLVEFYDNFIVCDTDFDGNYEVDLSLITANLLDNIGAFDYKFYLSLEDAQNQTNAIVGNQANIPVGQSLWVRANGNGQCFSIAEVPIQPGEAITYTEPTTAVESCYDPAGTIFNLTQVLPQLALSTGSTVKYFPSREDALASSNEITNPSAWTTTEQNGTIYLLISEEGKCNALVPFQFVTTPLPTIEIEENAFICEGETYTLDLSSYTNLSFTITGNVTEISNKVYQFTENGTYTITVTSDTGCINTYELEVTAVAAPSFTPFDSIEICDENFDGQYIADLAQLRAIAQANVGSGFTIKLFASEADANAGTNELTGDEYVFTTLPGKIWIRANALGQCFEISSVDYIANAAVNFTATTQVLEICEVENGTVLNLTSMAPLFNLATGVTVKYFTSLEDAQANTNAIVNPAAYSPAEVTGTIYVRFHADGLCPSITSFNYVINPLPVITIDNNIEICEGETYILDLSSYTDYTITVTGGSVRELSNKVFELSATGTYTINVSSSAGCSKTFTVQLTVNPLPVFTSISTFNVCDSNVDGEYELDLVELSGLVLENTTGVTLSFFASEADLLADRNEITTDIYLTTLPAQIWVKAITTAGCFVHKAITLTEGTTINVAPAARPLEVCEGPNGVNEFDLSLIRAQFGVPSGYILSYYPTLNDLQNGTNEILNPTVWTTTTTSGTIYVKFEAAGLCPGYSTFQYVVNTNPTIEIEDKYNVCEGEDYVLDLSSYTNYTITVTGENVVSLGNRKFRLSALGIYNVTVTNASGCTTDYSFELTNYPPPVVSEIIIAANTITVNVVRDPSYTPGLLQYSLDGINFQTSNILDIPQRGRSYNIFVKVGNCIYMIQSVEVIDIPTFFSPNNDGINDVWKIKPILLTQAVDLKIFDRFGKILYEQNDNQDIKWDGKVNGKPLPTTDYWFTIDIVGDGVVKAINFTGSITLKNKE